MYNEVRHSMGWQLLDIGYDLSLVEEQLGHTESEMKRCYAKWAWKILADAAEERRGSVINIETVNSKNKL